MTKRFLTALAVLALASFALSACGGGDEVSTTAAESSTETDTGGSSSASGGTISVEADPGGELAFTETELTGTAGTNTVELTNDSSTPHDLVIEDSAGSEVAATDTISGSSTTADGEFEAGEYTFYCSVPGHREAGMEGTIRVK